MHHTGTLYLSRTRPVVDTAPDGAWRITLLLFDRQGPQKTEAWRVRWAGEEARAWHAAHKHLLEPGAVLRVQLERARSYLGQANTPEIHAKAICMQIEPKRQPATRDHAQTEEHPAHTAA